MSNVSERIEQLSPLKRALLTLEKMQAKITKLEQAKTEPIAIIGMGCRFPGSADSPTAFWQMLSEGRYTTGELPKDRWDIDAFYDSNPGTPGKIYSRHGCFLPQIDQFDADFFGISPREAMSIDPQQRLLLEVSWEALESAGQVPENLKNSKTGVFVGIMYCDYNHRLISTGNSEHIDLYTSSGVGFSFVSGRLSYLLGLHGPSMVMDTACSSSLVSVHLACQSLRSQESRVALAGGVNVISSPEVSVALSRLRALSPDGRCKAFDAAADGYTRGEGCGMIVLKRLSDAIADGDQILALIRGSAVNHNGAGSGLTVPNGLAHQMLMKQSLENAQVQPHQVSYVEAHGTGTSLGDPIEIRALAEVYAQNRDLDNPLWVSSVKTNIGHLESAAGIAGLIKVVLALQHQKIPPHLHLQTVNPLISLEAGRIKIPVENTPWAGFENRRIAGLSSYGLSGTNAHLILEEANQVDIGENQLNLPTTWLLPLSARHPHALRDLAVRYSELLANAPDDFSLPKICYNASVHRSHHPYRLALVGNNCADLQSNLATYLQSQTPDTAPIFSNLPKNAFIFTESDLNWWNAGRQLIKDESVFQNTLEQCDPLFQKYGGWSLLAELASEEKLHLSQVALPLTVALQIALANLWLFWGIQPEAIAGDGLGEIAAAHIAGVLNLESAIELLFYQVAHRVNNSQHHQLAAVINNQPAKFLIYSRSSAQLGNGATMKPLDWGGTCGNTSSLTRMIDCLIANGYNIFLEISPESILSQQIAQSSQKQGLTAISLPHQAKSPIRVQLLETLGELYTLGYSVQWHQVYPTKMAYFPLPTYPWQRERYWLDIPEDEPRTVRNRASTSHPLLGDRLRELAHLAGQHFWEVELDVRSLSYLQDHQVQGRVVLPGSAYVEMALSATREIFGSKLCSLRDISFQKALFLAADERQTIQLLISTADIENQAEFQIFSHRTHAPFPTPWTLHATGTIDLNPATDNSVTPKTVGVETIQNRCPETISAITHYQTMASYGLYYGPCFQGVQKIWRNQGEVFAQIQLPNTLIGSENPYQIHPVLLDSAFQTFGAVQLKTENENEKVTYLPVGLKSLTVYGSLDQNLWSHLLLKPQADDQESLEGDIFLLNSQGEIIVEVLGFRGQRLDSASQKSPQVDVNDWFYEVEWQPQPLEIIPQVQQSGHWLIFADTVEVGQTLGHLFAKNGDTFTLVFQQQIGLSLPADAVQVNPADLGEFQELVHKYIQGGKTPCQGVVYCWGASVSQVEEKADLPENSEIFSCAVLNLTQALIKASIPDLPRLWLVTQGTQAITSHQVQKNYPISLLQSTVWGLGKVIILEHPELRCTLVDLSFENLLADLPILEQEIRFNSHENQVTWREQTRYVARLVRAKQEQVKTNPPSLFKTDATYLITGGMGGLGLTIAQWMIAQGSRHLALMGRSAPSETAQKAIAQMEATGARIMVVLADVSQSLQVAQALQTVKASMPSVKGIIHSAAVLDDGILLQLNQKRFQKVINPKVLGAWNLHLHTLDRSLDFFVLFSSAASLIGSPGQGNYSAANAFLDTLAHYRQSRGLTGLSINWGAWSEVGLAATETNQSDRFSDSGFGTIAPALGLDIFAKLLQNKSAVQLGILPANWQILSQSSPALVQLPFLRDLMSQANQLFSPEQISISGKRAELLLIEPDQRPALLTSWLREYIAHALRLPTEKLDTKRSLNYVNLDSLIAVELKNWIEKEIGISVPMADLLEGPSIVQLAAQVVTKLSNEAFSQKMHELPGMNWEQPGTETLSDDWEDGEI